MSDEPIPVGPLRDWQLDLYEAMWKTGEVGFHLRFRRDEAKFVMFLGRVEATELIGRPERLLGQEEQNR